MYKSSYGTKFQKILSRKFPSALLVYKKLTTSWAPLKSLNQLNKRFIPCIKINKNNNLDEKQILNQELKIRLNNTIRDISRVAGLMANNTIIDEDTLSLVKKLKNELRFLNEQTELYSSQQKF